MEPSVYSKYWEYRNMFNNITKMQSVKSRMWDILLDKLKLKKEMAWGIKGGGTDTD